MPTEPRPAATVVLLREGPDGAEVLLLRRSRAVGFFPNAWVFPGGRVDPHDASAPRTGSVPGLEPAAEAAAVAAVRETFEESGVWLGAGDPPAVLREAINGGTATLADADGLVADLSRLRLWARWVTPIAEPRRYDTWFFVAAVPRSAVARHDDGETVSSAWVRPSAVLAAPHDWPTAPPTWRTLEELAGVAHPDEALAAASGRDVRPICPRLERAPDDAWQLVLPGDPTYPSDAPVVGPTRISFRQGRWWSH